MSFKELKNEKGHVDSPAFLYSVVLTKGPNTIIGERQDMEESLIGENV